VLRVAVDAFDIRPCGRWQRLEMLLVALQQNPAQPDDQVKRRAQLVADGGEEPALHPIRLFGQSPSFRGRAIQLRGVECTRNLLGDCAVECQVRRVERCVAQLAVRTDQWQQRLAEGLAPHGFSP